MNLLDPKVFLHKVVAIVSSSMVYIGEPNKFLQEPKQGINSATNILKWGNAKDVETFSDAQKLL